MFLTSFLRHHSYLKYGAVQARFVVSTRAACPIVVAAAYIHNDSTALMKGALQQ